MTTSQQIPFLSEILEGVKIPLGKLAYFRGRLRHRLYDLIIREFLRQEKAQGLTRGEVARRIGRNPAQITRWFSTPSNWTLDTISDLMVAMGTEPDFSVGSLVEEKPKNLVSGGREELAQGFGQERTRRQAVTGSIAHAEPEHRFTRQIKKRSRPHAII